MKAEQQRSIVCPKCGNVSPIGTPQCPRCGLEFAPSPVRAGRSPWLYAALGALAVLLALLAMVSMGILGKPGQAVPPVTQAMGKAASPALERTAAIHALPPDVAAWLEHLRRIEDRKVELAQRQVAEAMIVMQRMQVPTMGDADQAGEGAPPSQQAKAKIEDWRPPWDALLKEFEAVTPPDECKPISGPYFSALNEVGALMGDLSKALAVSQEDQAGALQALEKLQGHTGQPVDERFKAADGAMKTLCDHYLVAKPFDIKADVGVGGLFGKF
ncbi:MAG: hypothetical protein HYR64_07155 [Fimbriimonas ginsengisoli]|uniref:Uncharacterized protein n=1 Tax=Fimbriimonas ginsengisoli TaxID=1005039 RepID=A0A931PUS8_FIMGI|nr:hypothetical protein [Fimbriimonas ginsengisoli]